MTPKTLFIAILMALGFAAHAQVAGGAGKMFIIQDSARDSVISSSDPAATLSQVDRLVLSHSAGKVTEVAECKLRICREVPVNQTISLDSLNSLNHMVGAQRLDDGIGEGPCRVCERTTSVPMTLDEYFTNLKSLENK